MLSSDSPAAAVHNPLSIKEIMFSDFWYAFNNENMPKSALLAFSLTLRQAILPGHANRILGVM